MGIARPVFTRVAFGAEALLVLLPILAARAAVAAPPAVDPALFIDFNDPPADLKLVDGPRVAKTPSNEGGVLEFSAATQYAEVPFARKLDRVAAVTVGGWFLPRRAGEQALLSRGRIEVGPNGERLFRPRDRWVDFVLGTDDHGFLLGTVHGNGSMPFPFVTLNEVAVGQWSQLVVVKTADGYQKLYRNGVLVASDRGSAWAPKVRPFVDADDGEPVRVAVPTGGLAGEAWVYGRELSAEEVRRDFEAKRDHYRPAVPPEPVALRDMDARDGPHWERRGGPLSRDAWPARREQIGKGMTEVFGRPASAEVPPAEPKGLGEEDCGVYVRRKLSICVGPGDDRMPFYLLVPKKPIRPKAPTVICFYGTTGGSGKLTTVGLAGNRPGDPPERNRAFAVDLAEAGFIAVAPDYLRDGERVAPGRRPYDTTDFYARHPDWSVHGKDAWDTSRLIDYLQTLDFVDADRIGMVGHSYGGHSTIFTAAMEPRIKCAVANGPVSDFILHGQHWAVPKGGGASQSLPAMRPYVLDPTLRPPVTFFEVTAMIAPRPLLVGQAVGERRPMEEENHAAVAKVYSVLGAPERARYVWYPGDHDFPPQMRALAVDWFRRWLTE